MNFLPPPKITNFWAPRKKVFVPHLLGCAQGTPHDFFFWGGFWGQTGANLGPKKFSLLFFSWPEKVQMQTPRFFFAALMVLRKCSEFSPKFSRICCAFFRGKRRPLKFHKKNPCLFIAKSPDNSKKRFTDFLWRAGKVAVSLATPDDALRDFTTLSGLCP